MNIQEEKKTATYRGRTECRDHRNGTKKTKRDKKKVSGGYTSGPFFLLGFSRKTFSFRSMYLGLIETFVKQSIGQGLPSCLLRRSVAKVFLSLGSFSCEYTLHLFGQVARLHTRTSFAATDHCSVAVLFDSLPVQATSTVSDSFAKKRTTLQRRCFHNHRPLLGIPPGLRLHPSQLPISLLSLHLCQCSNFRRDSIKLISDFPW